MKSFTKKSFLNKVKKVCNYDDIVFIACTYLVQNWWTVIVKVKDEYRIYRSVCDWVEEDFRINYIANRNALQTTLEHMKKKL